MWRNILRWVLYYIIAFIYYIKVMQYYSKRLCVIKSAINKQAGIGGVTLVLNHNAHTGKQRT